jgi:hypothetical protein
MTSGYESGGRDAVAIPGDNIGYTLSAQRLQRVHRRVVTTYTLKAQLDNAALWVNPRPVCNEVSAFLQPCLARDLVTEPTRRGDSPAKLIARLHRHC